MKRLRIRHVTGFAYSGDVTASYNEARMLPVSSDGQLVISSGIEIAPVNSHHNYIDYWGTRVASFEILTPHRELSITANSVVEVRPRSVPPHEIDWESLARVAAGATATIEQLGQTPLSTPPADVADMAERIARHHRDPAVAALEICHAVGEALEYVPGVTSVHSSATDAWSHRKGVCQDIAHVALGALRSVGIPARYVSGYLHPRPSAEVGETITGESHAWVEWYTGAGWQGFDPTNDIEIGDRHVLVGRGRDYNDVPPLRGVYAGSVKSTLFVTVEITREA
ncbi:MAG: transglutaminase family protein [Microbacteriaceae bacterium]|nr:transglutaminase family protein [Microbacteriaceae bacterium]